jgi:phospholipid-translocating ATPase
MTLFIYEAYTSFSGQAAYNDWAMSVYNLFFTSLPVIALGVLDQDVSARFCLKFPMLYQEGPRNDLFHWSRILGWMFNGAITSVIIFFLLAFSFGPQSFRHDGQPADLAPLGAAMYTCCVWAVNSQMALSISYFTLIQHVLIWGSVALWYVFLLVYGAMTPSFSTTYYMIFVQELALAPLFWITTLCVSVAALVPYFAFKAVQTSFFPGMHDFIQWMRHEGKADDPELGRVIRQASVRASVGVSARFDARINQQTSRVHHGVHTP